MTRAELLAFMRRHTLAVVELDRDQLAALR